jgi:HK97 family phage major capsid protein
MENLTAEQVVEKLNTLFVEKTKGMATSDDLSAIKAELSKLSNLESKSASIESAIAKFEGQLEAMKETAKNSTKTAPKTLKEAINMTIAEKHAEIVDSIEKGNKIALAVKTDTTITGDYTGTVALSTLEAGVNKIARPIRRIMEISNVGTTSSKFVTYIQQTTASTTAPVAEAAAKSNGQVQYQEVSVEVKKIAGFIKVSKEMLADLAFVQSEINNDLMEEVMQDIDNGLLNGNGIGANLDGVLGNSTVWAAGVFAGGIIPQPNVIDVLRIGKAQVESNDFYPTHIVLNPADVARIELSKATGGEYTYPNFTSGMAPNMQLSGLTVISSTNITSDNFVIGDFSKFNVRVREGVNIQVGYEGDDFARNMVSILAEARLCCFVKANDTGAFVAGDFTTALAAL